MIRNITWKMAERLATQLIGFLASVILARLLDPSFFGTITEALIFITIAELICNEGLSIALIQKKQTDELDYSTVLLANLLIAIFLYIILFFTAPLIGRLFNESEVSFVKVFRFLSLRVILSAIHSVQIAYISKQMQFKKLFHTSLVSIVLSSTIGVLLAISNHGIWALVFQNLLYLFLIVFTLAVSIKKMPSLHFSFDRFYSMSPFARRILNTGLLIQGVEQFETFVIGKQYMSSNLAFYDKGKYYPHVIAGNINSSIVAVLFPKLAAYQNDQDKIKYYTKQYIRLTSYLLCPMMFGLAVVAKSFVSIFLTDKWLPCVPLLQAFCMAYISYPLHSANNSAIKALGRSDLILKIEIVKTILGLLIFLATVPISMTVAVYAMAIRSFISFCIEAYPSANLFSYSYKEQINDFITPAIMSLVMAVLITIAFSSIESLLVRMGLQIFFGVVIYLLLSFVTKNKEFYFILNIIKTLINKNTSK